MSEQKSEQQQADLAYARALARQIAADFFYDEDFQPGGGMAGVLASISDMTARLRLMIYIGEHHHPDQTWKARCLETNQNLNRIRGELVRIYSCDKCDLCEDHHD